MSGIGSLKVALDRTRARQVDNHLVEGSFELTRPIRTGQCASTVPSSKNPNMAEEERVAPEIAEESQPEESSSNIVSIGDIAEGTG